MSATASAGTMPLGAFAGLVGEVGGDPAQVISRAAGQLLGGADRSRLVIGVDDVHRLDDVSATLVHHLALHSTASLVLTLRTGERAPDAVTALWKDGQLARLELQALSRRETAQLLEAVLGGALDTGAADRLWALTRGNVLYLRHLFDGAAESGVLIQERGLWRLARTPSVPPGLAELIGERMGRMSQDVLDVVDMLALAEPLDVRLLGELVSPEAAELAEAVGVVEIERDGQELHARLAHPLFGEVRKTVLGELRARRLRGHIATALVGTRSRRPEDLLRRAVLMLDSDLTPDAQLLAAASERAMQLIDFPLADRLGRAALAAGGGFSAQRVVAFATMWVGRPADAESELPALTELAVTDSELVTASRMRATNLAWIQALPDDARVVLDAAAGRVRSRAGRLPLMAMRAMLDASLGHPAQAAQLAADILADAEASNESIITACCGLVGAFSTAGRADDIPDLVAHAEAAVRASPEFSNLRMPLTAYHVGGLLLAGYLKEATTVAHDCRRQMNEMMLGNQHSGLLMGETELALGRPASAKRWLQETRAAMEPYGDTGGWLYGALIELTQALAVSGEVAPARHALADMQSNRHSTLAYLEPRAVVAEAWVTAAEGAVGEATALARRAADIAVERGQFAYEVLALQAAAQFGDRTVTDRLSALTATVHGPRVHAAARHAAALAADDTTGLLEASRQYEEFGDRIAAADAVAQAAALLIRRGDKAAAHKAAVRASRLADACDGARSPALVAVANPLPITEREREIVTLAAEGLSNREIAERLVVSVRTVEGHLYRAGAKLGVTDRREFASLLSARSGSDSRATSGAISTPRGT